MGITIQQYRAAIGRWHGGRMKTLSTPTAPEQINTADCYQNNQNAVTVLRGPWKLHAAALSLLMASLLIHQLAIWPFPSGSIQGLTSSNQVYSTSISHLELMDGKSSCIALQCLKALLLIGGVEPNPGPHKTRDQQIEIQREILADLCAEAPDTTVRDTLRLYDPQLDTKALVKQINRTSKQNIVACLIYLGQPAMTDYKKDTCVNALICRIQNLFPDDCVFCKEEYCIKLTDTPLLSCKICGQGEHSPCILNHIQLQATETLTAEDIWRKINPTDLPGLPYLCPACEKATIPCEEDGKLKKPKPSIREENDGSHDDINGEDIVQNDGEPTFDEEEATSLTQEEIQSTHTEKRDNHSKTTEDEGATTSPHATMRSNICSFYRKGTCRYGVSGRGCPKEHPKPCRKLLQHGTKAPNGCTMGRNKCDKFHPKMCPTSIRKGECFNESCRLKHVIGTKRIPREQPDSETESPETPSNTQANSDFLDALRLLKAEMLEAVETRRALLVSSQSPAAQSHVPQTTSAPTSNMAPGQVTANPLHWTSPTTPMMHNMMYNTQWPQAMQQPYSHLGTQFTPAPMMYIPVNMGHVPGTQQLPMYMAAASTEQTR